MSVPFLPSSIHSANLDRESGSSWPVLGAGDVAVHGTEPLPSRGLQSGELGNTEAWCGLIQSVCIKATEPTLIRTDA